MSVCLGLDRKGVGWLLSLVGLGMEDKNILKLNCGDGYGPATILKIVEL